MAGTSRITSGSIVDADISSIAKISASKRQVYITKTYTQVTGTAIVDQTAIPVHIVRGASMTILRVDASWYTQASQAGGDDHHVEVNVLVDGTTVLSGSKLDIITATASLGVIEGTITDATHVHDQIVTVSVNEAGTQGSAGQGLSVEIRMVETFPV